ncbi:pitrilysin family protein [Marivirga harenae]|uniref:M16 family metallopeptidase n=1 Tax=Marivirga harenae TaxID=2010992 RepID=UPI0026DFC0A7|nr:pitrilysin family protein [Marivirga harenae]WKV12501.1 pitrilysin family protein [Marivirga harenae]|tara:strand:- start:19416 stop:21452 length:2037 start_codon:yes stop_codon:yes gene_type:complete
MVKKIYLSFVFALMASFAFAQVDRTTAPEPTPAKEINIGEPTTFTLKNGLKVFVVENHKLPRVAFSLTFDRDPVLEGDKAGYVSMAGQMLMKGTENRTKAELDQDIDFIGANINTYSTGMFATSLTKHQDKLMELMTDVLFNPAFPEDELDKLKKQTLSGLAASKDDPNAIASNVRGKLVYGDNHPYGEFETEESVENITLAEIKAYYDSYFRPNIGYLAIVGDITPKEAKKLIKKNFEKWEKGNVPTAEYEIPSPPEETLVALVDREASVQSVVNVTYPVELTIGDEDVIVARVLNQILGGGFSSRLMQNLREDKAFTYGARSSLSADEFVGSFTASASVRNEVTDSAVNEFMAELTKINEEGVTQEELDAAKASIAGSFARSLESPQTVASFAINTARYNLPKDYYANYLKNLEAVTLEDVKAAAQKYILPNNANILVVGKGEDVAKSLSRFGELKYYNRKGEEYDPNDKSAMPADLTAEKVLEKYFEALGGKAKLEAVKSMKTSYNASVQGQNISINEVKDNSNYKQEVAMGPMVLSKVLVNDEGVKVFQQGQEVPLPEQAKAGVKAGAKIFPELHYSEMGATLELKNVEEINGKPAYGVAVTMPSGQTSTSYFDAESGLKVKTSSAQASEEIKSYKEVDGIMIPEKRAINQGFQMNADLQSAELNIEIKEDTFQ